MAVINFGSINIDHVYQVERFVQPGETISSSNYQQLLGGKGANQSIALAKAGSDVWHVGRLHELDSHIKQTMIKHGINCKHVNCTETPTGHAIIQVASSGENAIVLFGGANRELCNQDILRALDGASPNDWVLTQNETSGIEEVLRQAKDNELKVAFNPAPMTESVKDLPHECIDLLIVNEVEAAAIAGTENLDEIEAYFKDNWAHAEIIITLGKQGVKMLREDEVLNVSAFEVEAIDTTAAGDTFIGYFLSAYNQKQDCAHALKRGCAASALAVTKEGAAQSIPSIEEVEQFLTQQNS